MTQHTIRRRWTSMLALGMIAALAMPGTAQATPQLGDLGVKQSMNVKASNGESLEGKDLRAIQLHPYHRRKRGRQHDRRLRSDHEHGIGIRHHRGSKAAGATDTNLTVNGKNDPMVWVVKNLTDSRSDPWSGKLRNFCNSLAKQTNFCQAGWNGGFHTQPRQSHHVDRQRTRTGNLRHRGPYTGDNHTKQRHRHQNNPRPS